MSMMNIGVSGMMSQAKKLNVISNNIANSDTLAYKSQWVQLMEEYVTQGRQTNNGNIIQGGEGVKVASVNADWSAGSVQVTNEPSNLMIAGDGFLPVAFNNEVYYTRAGDFSLVENPDTATGGFVLMRPNGATLVGYSALPIASSPSVANVVVFRSVSTAVPPADPIAPTSYEISADGAVTAKPEAPADPYIEILINGVSSSTAQLGVQRFNNQDSLLKSEGGLYKPTQSTSFASSYPVEPGTSGSGTITQGALEQSNTDLISEFTNMITSQRSFQANSKVITTADELLQTVMGLKR